VAISYDFDGTLAPGNMQEYDFIPALHMHSKPVWASVNNLAIKHEMDTILAHMHTMLDGARKAKVTDRLQKFRRSCCVVPRCESSIGSAEPKCHFLHEVLANINFKAA
jgi:hypothetical protein